MKEIILEKYKVINLILFIVIGFIFVYININYQVWFQNADIEYIHEVFDGIYHPLMVTAKWLAIMLGLFILLPSRIFKKWLFFIAPPILLLTYLLVASISVYSGSVLNVTRGQMAENGMIGLALVTAVFVLVHWLWDWRGWRRQ